MVRQSFGRRLLAFLIDALIVGIAVAILRAVFVPGQDALVRAALAGGDIMDLARSAVRRSQLCSAVPVLAYGLLEVFRAQGVGKMLLKMKITGRDGGPAARGQLARRYGVKYAASILGLLFGLTLFNPFNWLAALAWLAVVAGCLLALRRDRLALHDLLAETAVVGPGVAPAASPGPAAAAEAQTTLPSPV